ncbi:hypothetical protein [Bradyrhizobium sp. URHD0069]|uniref:hypothetical protein n=1 Tax=Bradyrhizobium sp. URHD0069 TaxID=1380355 RepID=UPI000B23072C|nr:hypothetical protein [Bradyrhizobium sp. URHD0069]
MRLFLLALSFVVSFAASTAAADYASESRFHAAITGPATARALGVVVMPAKAGIQSSL